MTYTSLYFTEGRKQGDHPTKSKKGIFCHTVITAIDTAT